MNINIRKQIISLIETVRTAIVYAQKNIKEAELLVKDSCDALTSIIVFLKEKEKKYDITDIVSLLEKLNNYSELKEEEKNDLLVFAEKEIDNIIYDIDKESNKRKIKAVFLPYKASMWTSLESIWKAADEDPNCEALVIPVPYHELDENNNKVNICYEGEKYPDYVPIKKFWEYRIPDERPDMIFIHNPYDDTNTVTRVLEEYYSRNLKNYTDMLVYSPYYTSLMYNQERVLDSCKFAAIRHVDKVIVQDEVLKKKYEESGCNSDKVLALGSPKVDGILQKVDISQEWLKKCDGKNVFLLNTTMTYIVKDGQKAINTIIDIFNKVTKNKEYFLIWRPHPLEEVWIQKKVPEFMDSYKKMKKIINESENSLVDLSSDYRAAVSISKAMFSTYSSLINEYMVTGKPVFVIEDWNSKLSYDTTYYYIDNYYINRNTIDEFINDVITEKEDKMKEKRLENASKLFPYGIDGKCGERIYRTLKKEVLNREE